MAWFDGTFEWDDDRLNEEFPVMISSDLRTNIEGTRIAVINNFENNSELYLLSDPHIEEEDPDYVFYHTFIDAADDVKAFIEDFVTSGACKEPDSISLFRIEQEEMFLYSDGHICSSMIDSQKELSELLTDEFKDECVYILPLKRYMHRCPVCGHRTLQYRGMFEICRECGWEDDGMEEDDKEDCFPIVLGEGLKLEIPGPNGDYTISEYRKEYLKLKAEDPDYTWAGQNADDSCADDFSEDDFFTDDNTD